MFAGQKMTIIVSFWQDSLVLTAERTAGAAAVCKAMQIKKTEETWACGPIGKPVTAKRSTLKKHGTSMSSTLEPAI